MAWLILALLLPTALLADDKKVCLTNWEPVAEKFWANGYLFSPKKDDPKILERKSLQGKILDEVKLPRPIQAFQWTQPEKGYLYLADNGTYYYNPDTKIETLLYDNNTNVSTDGKGNITMPSGKFFHGKSGHVFDFPPGVNIESKKNTIAYNFTSGPNKTKLKIIDTDTKKESVFDIPENGYKEFESENHLRVYGANEELSKEFVKIKGIWTPYISKKNEKLAGVLPNGEKLIFKGDEEDPASAKTEFQDANGKTIKTLPGAYFIYDGVLTKFNADESHEIYNPQKFFSDLKSKKQPVAYAKTRGEWATDEDGKWYTYQEGSSTKLINMETGKKFSLPPVGEDFFLTLQDGKVFITDTTFASVVFDPVTETSKALSKSPTYYVFDPNSVDYLRAGDAGELSRKTQQCFDNSVRVVENDCDCLKPGQTTPLDKVALVSACNSHALTFDWNKYTPAMKEGEISKDQALLYLNRFQKPNGYTPEHLSVLVSILKSDIVEKNSYEVVEALKQLDPKLLNELYFSLNLEKRLAKKVSKNAFICSSESDRKKLKDITQDLQNLTNERRGSSAYVRFLPYKYDFQELSAKDRELYVDLIAEDLSQKAAEDRALAGVFQSKLYHFSKKYALELMGSDFKPATDLSVSKSSTDSSIVLLSTSPIKDQKQVEYDDVNPIAPKYGFYFTEKAAMKIPKESKVGSEFKEKFTWANSDDSFEATVKYTVKEPVEKLLPRDNSPDYKAMRKDGEVTGLMVIGTNLAGHPSLSDHYLTYYQNEGFKFEAPVDTKALPFFEEQIKNGKLDYFIKEAHSDGDEKNLFRMDNQGKLFKGVRTRKDGTKEVMYILAPSTDAKGSTLISNQLFGEWMKERKEHNPLYYFNSSCNSSSKVITELPAVSSSNFIPIATDSLAYTFSNKDTNTMKIMLTSFRQEKDYEGIRQDMKKSSPRYASGKEDQFIFPDEEKYESSILEHLSINVDANVTLKNSKGIELHMDEQLDHN